MEKFTQIGLLIDFYGKLLTPKQLDILDMHYNNDYSLTEIGENLGISRQGVHDSLKRSESILNSYEEKLQLVDKFINQNEKIKESINKLKALKDECACNEKIDQIVNDLETLLYEIES